MKQFKHFFDSLGQWGSRVLDPRRKQLNNTMQTRKLCCLSSGKPTYWLKYRGKHPDLLDFCMIKGFEKENAIFRSSFDISSDHSPIISDLLTKTANKSSDPNLCNK